MTQARSALLFNVLIVAAIGFIIGVTLAVLAVQREFEKQTAALGLSDPGSWSRFFKAQVAAPLSSHGIFLVAGAFGAGVMVICFAAAHYEERQKDQDAIRRVARMQRKQ